MGTQRWLWVGLIAYSAGCASHHEAPAEGEKAAPAKSASEAGSKAEEKPSPPAPSGGSVGSAGASVATAGTGASSAGRPGASAGSSEPPPDIELDSAIVFNPAYSAFDGVRTFQVPITVRGYAGIEWETDRPDLVDLELVDSSTVMITTRGAGEARIIARTGALSGAARLTIAAVTPESVELGKALYAKGVMPPISGNVTLFLPTDVSCAGCHGGGAQALSVAYTPQQTGGYSDQELIDVFARGMKPPRTGFRSNIPMMLYTLAHTWPDPTDEEMQAMLAYLRSLTPISQGPIDFGGPP